MAAERGRRRRSHALHLADTLAAGDGLVRRDSRARILQAGPAAIAALARHGVAFDRRADGRLALGLEAAHSPAAHRPCRRRRHRRGDHARAHRGGAAHALHHRAGPAPRHAAWWSRTTASAACWSPRPQRRGDAAGRPRRDGDGRHRRAVPAHHQPAGVAGARACCWRRAPARRWPISNSCSSTRPRWPPAPIRCRWSARRCAARAPSWWTKPARASWRSRPAPNSARATWWPAASGATSPPAIGFSSMRARPSGTRFGRRFPAITAACRAAGIDPATQPMPVRAGGALPYGRHRRGCSVGAARVDGPVGLRRGGLDRLAWRQPARQQLAAGGRDLRALGGRGRGRRVARRPAPAHRPPPAAGAGCRSGAADPVAPCRPAARRRRVADGDRARSPRSPAPTAPPPIPPRWD